MFGLVVPFVSSRQVRLPLCSHIREFFEQKKKKVFLLILFLGKEKQKKNAKEKKYFLFCFVCQENRKNIVDIHKWNNNENFNGILSLRKNFCENFVRVVDCKQIN